MISSSRATWLLAPLSAALATGLFFACQSTDAEGGGASGVDQGRATKPNGCKFQVAPRPEYLDYGPDQPVVGPSPNIRRVRRGLGGNVAVGAEGRADARPTAAFAWQTDDGPLVSEVAWGSDPDPTKWPAENRVGGTTWKTPPGGLNPQGEARMHEAYVCGLTPATTYYYRVGGGPKGGEVWSDVYTFTTAPSDPAATVKIAVTGDSRGQENDAWRVLQLRVTAMTPTLQLFSGDMINFGPDQQEWEKWLDGASRDAAGKPSTLAQVLTLAAHGNHDNHNTLFYANMVLPADVAKYPAYTELFYSLDVGPVHVVVLDDFFVASNTDPDFKSAIGDWLEQDLGAANANRAKVPWIVVMHHHPEFSSSTHGKDADVLRVRNFFTPIWDKHHVDVSLAGHDHDYERSKPLTGPADNPTIKASPAEGTTYIVCAGSGADAYGAGTSAFTQTSKSFGNGGALGVYGLLTGSKEKLTFQAHFLTADGTDPVIDELTITK